MGTYKNQKKLILILSVGLCLILFQNCSNDFKSNLEKTGQSQNQGPQTENPTLMLSCGSTPHLGTESIRMYRQERGATCEGQTRTRTCFNGEWSSFSGSDLYQFTSCEVQGVNTASCGNTPHGDIEVGTFYPQETVPYGQSCGSGMTQTRQCNNGEFSNWSGPLVHRSCEVEPPPVVEPPVSEGPDDLRLFIFGHSLIVHEHTPSPTEEKKVPHWLSVIAGQDNKSFAADGQYGFLQNHANFNNISPQWGFPNVTSTWTNENTPFSQVDFNLIMMTPANFIQYQAPSAPYFDNPSVSPLSATLEIYDQSRAAHPGIPFYIYENWPDMGGYGAFPGGVDFARYNRDTRTGDFHQWFLDYHDSLLSARPGSQIKMIPVGPIISGLVTQTPLQGIPLTSLYEDDAPHGQPTLYFLASLITYSAIYKTQPPDNLNIPNTVHPLVRNNYSTVINYIWNELQNFNYENGESRVF